MRENIKEGKSYVLTKAYKRGWFSKPLKKGTSVQVTRRYDGWTGTFLDVRLDDGTFVRKIPYEYFRT